MMSINDFLKAVAILADFMTIFGISGLFTWSFFEKEKHTSYQNSIRLIMVYSVKSSLAISFSLVILYMFYLLHLGMVFLMSQSLTGSDGLWNSSKSIYYTISYSILSLTGIPFVILSLSCIYSNSLKPYKEFFRLYSRKKNDKIN